jgi:hypothetical protein
MIASVPVTTGILAPQLTSWKCKYAVLYVVPKPQDSRVIATVRVVRDDSTTETERWSGLVM